MSSQPALTAIAALDPDRIIGRDGTLPWHLPEDLRLFKSLTMGSTLVMGRKTWDSLPRKPLPGRPHIVLSRTLENTPEGVDVVRSAEELSSRIARSPGPVFLIGGEALYRLLLPSCDSLVLTHVFARHPGDARFPEFEHAFEPVETLAETADFRTLRYRPATPPSRKKPTA